jgi:23S rRNA pseudouridine1911/1915/1917 synthase
MQKYPVKVLTNEAGQRLDLFVVIKLDFLTRSTLKKLINSAQVKVNDRIEFRPHYKVKENDIIEVSYQKADEVQNHIIPQNINLDIIYEDKDLLVINKPNGMVIHPAQGNAKNTLMNAVIYHYQKLASVGSEIRSGLIHRIDKDTSGVVLVGKTNKGLWYYSRLFAERKVKKTYLAIVAGNIKNQLINNKITIKGYLGRNPKNRKKMAEVSIDSGGKYAETEIFFDRLLYIDRKPYSVVLALPKTGRTHQIRVHLSNFGYPILGDKIYGKNNKYSRLLLHAWKLSLNLLDGNQKEFIADIPKEFNL